MADHLVVKLGWEGGGLTIFDRDETGLFWYEGTTMAMDEHDSEVWKPLDCEPTSDLGQIVPEEWAMLSPMKIGATYIPWFRERFEDAWSRQPDDQKMMLGSRLNQNAWRRVFAGEKHSFYTVVP
jgi:hypothetical protein